MAATANLSKARSHILPQIFLAGCFLLVYIERLLKKRVIRYKVIYDSSSRGETQNQGNVQALPVVAALDNYYDLENRGLPFSCVPA